MGELYGLLIFIGIVLIGLGIVIHKYPNFMWEFSFERRWYVKGGEPTEHYYTVQRIRAVTNIIIGVIMILVCISMIATDVKGYVVELDGKELKIPCTYSDMEELGYHIDSTEEIKTIRATTKNIKNFATYIVTNNEGKEIKITFENRDEIDKPATECDLVAIYVTSENGPKITLPNGVNSKMSRKEVKEKMGKGTTRGVGGSASEYRVSVNFNTYRINIVYEGGFTNNKIESIRVEDSLY